MKELILINRARLKEWMGMKKLDQIHILQISKIKIIASIKNHLRLAILSCFQHSK